MENMVLVAAIIVTALLKNGPAIDYGGFLSGYACTTQNIRAPVMMMAVEDIIKKDMHDK